jgi:hypothetical protein
MIRSWIAVIACALAFGAADASAATCTEDSPCWNWVTMGNHQRGWVDTWGNPRVGGPCRFARAYRHHWIFEYRKLQRMRGDRLALRICSEGNADVRV